MIGNISRQLMQDVDVSGVPDFDDASFLELISTIDDQEGFTLDQLMSGRDGAAITIPIPGLAEPLSLKDEEIASIVTDLTRRNNGIPPSPSVVLEQAYTDLRKGGFDAPAVSNTRPDVHAADWLAGARDYDGDYVPK